MDSPTQAATTQGNLGSYDDEQAGTHGAAEPFMTLLARAVMNEKLSPEILHYQEGVLDEARAAVSAQNEVIDALEQQEGAQLERLIMQADTQRIQYLLRSYHRVRVDKVMRWAACILDSPELQARLCHQELQFAQKYFVAGGKLMKAVLLDQLPAGFRSLVKLSDVSSDKDLIARPGLDAHVVVRALEDCGHVVVDSEGLTVDLARGEVLVIRYAAIAQLLHDGRVELV